MTIQSRSISQKMKFRIFPAPDKLREEVECFRSAEYTGKEGLAITVPPNGRPGIVFQHRNGQSPIESIITPFRSNLDIPTLYVYGQHTEPGVLNHKKGPYTMTQVILKPHALNTLLGMNASTLTNGLVELNEFSTDDLDSQLLEADSEQERITLLTDFLMGKLKQEKTRDRLVEESLRLIHRSIGSVTVRTLVDYLNISERQFEKRFSQTVGISPRFYIRVKRFNEAIRLMKIRRPSKLTDIAYALNFYDQSHFIRDVRAFSGITPKSLSQKEDVFDAGQAIFSYLST